MLCLRGKRPFKVSKEIRNSQNVLTKCGSSPSRVQGDEEDEEDDEEDDEEEDEEEDEGAPNEQDDGGVGGMAEQAAELMAALAEAQAAYPYPYPSPSPYS